MSPALWALAAANGLAFLLHAWDKLAARRRRRRVRESRLLLAAAPFAAAGAWLAVLLLRHKSSKARYLVRLGLITGAQALLLGWALGRGWIRP